jgi:hypothetical protein
MTSKGLGKMFEGNFADCAKFFFAGVDGGPIRGSGVPRLWSEEVPNYLFWLLNGPNE